MRVFRAVFSSELGATKPDPRSYESVVRALGAAPTKRTFVDDGSADAEGARAAGWGRVVLYRHRRDLARL